MPGGLHPNLAKVASAYDDVLRRLASGQIDDRQAGAEIAQLEARDDTGTRWCIDPGTGQWMRKTAFGDLEFDSDPPSSGYMTPDAFNYTPDAPVFNPQETIRFSSDTELRRTDAASPRPVAAVSPRQTARHLPKTGRKFTAAVVALAVTLTAAALILWPTTAPGGDMPDMPVSTQPAP